MRKPLRTVESPEWREFNRLFGESIVRRAALAKGADVQTEFFRLYSSLLSLIQRTPHPIDRAGMIPITMACARGAGVSSEEVNELFVQFLEETRKVGRSSAPFSKTGMWLFVSNLWTCAAGVGRVQEIGPVFRECLEWSGDLLADAIRTGPVNVLFGVKLVMESIVDHGLDPSEFPRFRDWLKENCEVLRSRAGELRDYVAKESGDSAAADLSVEYYLEFLEQFVDA